MGLKKDIRIYKNKNGNYYYNIRGMGFKSSGKKNKKECEAIAEAQLALLGHGKMATGTLGAYAEPYFTDRCPRTARMAASKKPYSENYIKRCRRYLERFLFPDIISTMQLGDVRRGNILDFKKRVRDISGSDYSADHMIKTLSVIFNEAIFREEYDRNPAALVRSTLERKKEIPALPSELFFDFFPKDSLGPWENQEQRACFMLAAFTGMRRSEVLGLRWSNIISYVNKNGEPHYVIRVWEAIKINKKHASLEDPKMGKLRETPLPVFMNRELQKLPVKSKLMGSNKMDFVFSHPDGGNQTYSWWRTTFKKALKKLGLENSGFYPHHFRHMLNSHLDGNTNIKSGILRDSFGWSDEQTRKRYTQRQVAHLEVISDYLDDFYTTAAI